MSLGRRVVRRHPNRFPRVSGDEPDQPHYIGRVTMFSPRERG